MTGGSENSRRSAQARDMAVLRLRRVTQLSVALMVAVGGAFTALAAGSTHTKKTTLIRHQASRVTASAAILVRAPAPPLVGAQAAPPPPSRAPVPAVTAPAPVPEPTYQQPVVVSGGS